ncbi:queuosine precursor transporter [Saprospira grandis]|uniref:Probable queuosine precursor transporter n=1 Tax=Saprospira grandis (strain Lewin) TaxID=984262 RepID=H6L0Y9_SAPGL|nr:queuosine precursor transporter [Saprospira grandis]AFC25945.1 hypothetical protein SGRA_3217 [Saprospira grandis str. Lewin]
MNHIIQYKANRLFLVLGGFFIANAIIAEFIGVKIFSLEASGGFDPLGLMILGYELNLDLTAGVLLWPVVFIMTDVINEYFGAKGVRFLSQGAVVLILYAFLMVFLSIALVPASWWPGSRAGNGGPEDMQIAFQAIFGQGLWIIVGSLTAFLVGQIVDVIVFQRIKRATGESRIWMRATGSTLVSQLIDSFVVLYIAFGLGADWTFDRIIAVGTVNYIYKFTVAILLTPLLYWMHHIIDNYLGKKLADELKHTALLPAKESSSKEGE